MFQSRDVFFVVGVVIVCFVVIVGELDSVVFFFVDFVVDKMNDGKEEVDGEDVVGYGEVVVVKGGVFGVEDLCIINIGSVGVYDDYSYGQSMDFGIFVGE